MAGPGSPPGPQASEPVSWPVVLGLGALALLFPVAELTGASDALGAVPTALLVLGLVAAVWIGGVGLLRVPRPVLTLTLAGAVSGVVLVVLSVALGTRPGGGGLAVLVGAFEVVRSTVLGTLAGVLAAVVQHTRSPRR
ncbi:hypothetical protein [Geodermatophilus sp. URMC 65]